ncbi:hypothetical protein GCM10007147_17970 [Nocardiopsis kunsanensis]|uniref:Uncharacterized protein n=2 Tax=Nocardiopsis kunsanensis TaxID=141693 RepID=A0A919CHN5_9ACTN|nr:hypothetical protein GCM10007147_17970 [Nocardiopsis kunsanensis]
MQKFMFTATSALVLSGGLLLAGPGTAAADDKKDDASDGCTGVGLSVSGVSGDFSEKAEKAADALNDKLKQDMAGNMNARTATCAKEVVEAAKDRDMGKDAAAIAMATTIVETHLNNYTGGDRDSVGLFQQRNHYGSSEDRLDVGWATEAFFDELSVVYPGDSWKDVAPGEVAQDVQRSAYPDRYHHQIDDAEVIVDHLW